mmetsp:Transcript_12856/g.36562  ORF Transcript_12856/g.36562 Transcript_12856/m.36562 type:complete len:130 (-) Transcript_12856:822-1211(-)
MRGTAFLTERHTQLSHLVTAATTVGTMLVKSGPLLFQPPDLCLVEINQQCITNKGSGCGLRALLIQETHESKKLIGRACGGETRTTPSLLSLLQESPDQMEEVGIWIGKTPGQHVKLGESSAKPVCLNP